MRQEQGERPTPAAELLACLPATPDAYVQKFDLLRDVALLIKLDANDYREASFLDDRILAPGTKGGWVSLARVVAAARSVDVLRPLHFIFHTGHVGSTLVSRLLEETHAVLSLREPLPLRLLAEAYDVLAKPESLIGEHQFSELLGAFLRLWSRTYADDRCAIVKATSSTGRIANILLGARTEARAIYLNLRPEPYLAALLSGRNSPVDLRGHAAERTRRLAGLGLANPPAVHRLSLGELAAMSWLAESWSRRDALATLGQRLIAVDFDAFLADIAGGMRRILAHFGLGEDTASDIAQSSVLTRYAKAPEHAFSPALRTQVLDESRLQNRAEIRKGLALLETLARNNAAIGQVVQTG